VRQLGPICLRVSVTDRCRLRCLYCTPAEGVERFAPGQVLRYEEILWFVRLIQAHMGLAKVHLTGGEPLDRRRITTVVAMLAGEGIGDLAMTTNGQRLRELAGDLRRAGLHRVNISLNTLQPATFRSIASGGELAPTLDGAEAALEAGFTAVKFNTTVLRGLNDVEVVDIARFGLHRGAEVRFIELMPLGPAAQRYGEWFVSSREVLQKLRAGFDLQPLPRPAGSSSRPHRVTDGDGRTGSIGLISPCSEPFCGDCHRLRLTADGHLVGCLARSGREDILPILRDAGPRNERRILEKVVAVMGRKRTGDRFATNRCMAKLGG
jgi:cyclic pyranopterin phosphate synthase